MTTLGLAFAFFAQEMSLAAPLAQVRQPMLLEIPPEFAALKEMHTQSSDAPFLIHIQDAHANISGQENLAKTLDVLMERYGVSLILSEGGSGDCSLTSFKKIASQETWNKVAKSFLMQGKIAGEEYVNLTSKRPMKIMGVEDMPIYMKNVEQYAVLAEQREAALSYLKEIRRAVEKLKVRFYPKQLLDYEKSHPETGDHFEESFKKLSDIAAENRVSLDEFVYLEKLRRLKERENIINFSLANLEHAALVEEIAQSAVKKADPSSERVQQLAYFQNTLNIARGKGIAVARYTNLLAYVDYLEAFADLDLDKILEELEKAEDKVYAGVLKNRDARLLRSIDRYLRLLVEAYNIRMTTKEFDLFRANEPDFATFPCLAFLNRKLLEQGYSQDVIGTQDALDKGKQALEAFYRSVGERDFVFMRNVRNILSREKQKVAVLITGGYHTPHLKELLRKEGYSYAVITPVVTSQTNQGRYEKNLLAPVRKSIRTLETSNGQYKKPFKGDDLRETLLLAEPAGGRLSELLSGATSPERASEVLKARNAVTGARLAESTTLTEEARLRKITELLQKACDVRVITTQESEKFFHGFYWLIDLSKNPIRLKNKKTGNFVTVKQIKILLQAAELKKTEMEYIPGLQKLVFSWNEFIVDVKAEPWRDVLNYLKGDEFEIFKLRSADTLNNSHWNAWTDDSDYFYTVYGDEIDPTIVQTMNDMIEKLPSGHAKNPFIMDLFAGDGRLIRKLRTTYPSGHYMMAERNEVLVNEARKKNDSSISVEQVDLVKAGNFLELTHGERPDIMIASGGLNMQVTDPAGAQAVVQKAYDALTPGGYFIATGLTEVWLKSSDFKKIGFEVLNMSMPKNVFQAHQFPQEFYILRKPDVGVQAVRPEAVTPAAVAGARLSGGMVVPIGHRPDIRSQLAMKLSRRRWVTNQPNLFSYKDFVDLLLMFEAHETEPVKLSVCRSDPDMAVIDLLGADSVPILRLKLSVPDKHNINFFGFDARKQVHVERADINTHYIAKEFVSPQVSQSDRQRLKRKGIYFTEETIAYLVFWNKLHNILHDKGFEQVIFPFVKNNGASTDHVFKDVLGYEERWYAERVPISGGSRYFVGDLSKLVDRDSDGARLAGTARTAEEANVAALLERLSAIKAILKESDKGQQLLPHLEDLIAIFQGQQSRHKPSDGMVMIWTFQLLDAILNAGVNKNQELATLVSGALFFLARIREGSLQGNPYVNPRNVMRGFEYDDTETNGNLSRTLDTAVLQKKPVHVWIVGAGAGEIVRNMRDRYGDQIELQFANKATISITPEEYGWELIRQSIRQSRLEPIIDIPAARSHLAYIQENVKLMDIEKEITFEGQADVIIISSETLRYIRDKFGVISRLQEKLNLGGKLFVMGFNRIEIEQKVNGKFEQLSMGEYIERLNAKSGAKNTFEYIGGGDYINRKNTLIITHTNNDILFPALKPASFYRVEWASDTAPDGTLAPLPATYEVVYEAEANADDKFAGALPKTNTSHIRIWKTIQELLGQARGARLAEKSEILFKQPVSAKESSSSAIENENRSFLARHRQQWQKMNEMGLTDRLIEKALEQMKNGERPQLTLVSYGVSTGEEMARNYYEIGVVLGKKGQKIQDWDIQIVGLDKNSAILREAQARIDGQYPFYSIQSKDTAQPGDADYAEAVVRFLNQNLSHARRSFIVRQGDIYEAGAMKKNIRAPDLVFINHVLRIVNDAGESETIIRSIEDTWPDSVIALGDYARVFPGPGVHFEHHLFESTDVSGKNLNDTVYAFGLPLEFVSKGLQVSVGARLAGTVFSKVYGARLTEQRLELADVKNVDEETQVLLARWLLSRGKEDMAQEIPILATLSGPHEENRLAAIKAGRLNPDRAGGSIIFDFGDNLESAELEISADVFRRAKLSSEEKIVERMQDSVALDWSARLLRARAIHKGFFDRYKGAVTGRSLQAVIPGTTADTATAISALLEPLRPLFKHAVDVQFDGPQALSTGQYTRRVVLANPDADVRRSVLGKAGLAPMPEIVVKNNGEIEMGSYVGVLLLEDMLAVFNEDQANDALSDPFVDQMLRLVLASKYVFLERQQKLDLIRTLIHMDEDKGDAFYSLVTFELLRPIKLSQILDAARLVMQAVGAAA